MIKTKYLIKMITILSIASLLSVSAVPSIVLATETTPEIGNIEEQEPKESSANSETPHESDAINDSKDTETSDTTADSQVTKDDDKTPKTADTLKTTDTVYDSLTPKSDDKTTVSTQTADTTEKSWLATELEDNQPFITATVTAVNKSESEIQKSDLEKLTTLRVNGASSIPEKISDYTALSSLSVNNGTVSRIPEGLYALNRTLTRLDIKNNKFIVLPDKLFDDSLWTGQSTGLIVLCDNNQIVSNIPRNIKATGMLDYNSRNNMLEYYNFTDYHNNPQAQLMYKGAPPAVTVPVGFDFNTAIPDTTNLSVYVTDKGYQDLFPGHEFVYDDDGTSPVIQNGVATRAGTGKIWVKSKFSTASNPFAKTQIKVTVTAPVVAGDVTVKYEDTSGNSLSEAVVKSGNIGESYTTKQEDIEGYVFKEVKGDAVGKFTTAPQTVTYVYEPAVNKSTVVVRDSELTIGDTWQPEDNFVSATNYDGDSIPLSAIHVEGTVDTSIAGIYKVTYMQAVPSFLKTTENEGDYFATATITVKEAEPVKGGDITTTYVDVDGNPISETAVKTGLIGETYTTEQKDIKGYSFKEVQGVASGKFTDQPQTVVYVYTKNKSDVVNPEPNPDSNSDSKTGNQPIGKSDNQYQSKASVSSNQKQTLPETGETDSMTLMSVSLGLLLSAVTLLALALRLKQTQK